MIYTITYGIGNSYYNITTDDINETESVLYLTDTSGNITDFPDNTTLYFYSNAQKNIVEKSNQKYIIKNDIYYELQINNIIWGVSDNRKWNYELLKY
jgi:hypothetical protein